MTEPILFIFAKAPVLGRAKTRLAATEGIVHAKRLYRMMVARVLRRVEYPKWRTLLAVTPPSALGRVKDWNGFSQVAQVSGSLSPRLAACFARKGPTIVIGTDSPQIRAQDIADALKLLKRHRVVFGPASDGGFWLIGANGPLPAQTLTDIDDIAALADYRRSRVRFLN